MTEEYGILKKKLPRVMIAAPGSGSGKTTIVCGLLQAFLNRDITTNSYKCGPDYIDPMYHRTVLGVPTGNLDAFFTKTAMMKYLFASTYRETATKDSIAIIEGVMGYYDGKTATSMEGSSYDIAVKLDTPVILVVNAKGASLSIVPLVKGFLSFQKPPMISGILLNQMSSAVYDRMKDFIESETGVTVVGYVPPQKEFTVESRHLGLVTPNEITNCREQIQAFSQMMEKTVDFEKIKKIAEGAAAFSYNMPDVIKQLKVKQGEKKRIAIAEDEAFCFYYEENKKLLEQMGMELISFSPLHDKKIPEDISGLLLGGGYPELYCKELSENVTMRQSILEKLNSGLPCMAECGGFLYLQETLQEEEGMAYPMVGFLNGHGKKAEKRKHFGYITVEMKEESMLGEKGTQIPAHEFHYWESDEEGNKATATKPDGIRNWSCMRMKKNVLAGFPHLYYSGNIEATKHFTEAVNTYTEGSR